MLFYLPARWLWRTFWQQLLVPSGDILATSYRLTRQYRWRCLGYLLATAAVCVVIWPLDEPLVALLGDEARHQPLRSFAKTISHLGKFEVGTLSIVLTCGLLGAWLRRPVWVRGAIGILLAATIAGLAANVLRPTVGRARPSADVPPGMYGPSLDYDYHSFPSAHAATAAATCVALTMVIGRSGTPFMLAAILVAWSRLYLERHHLSDVLVGLALGALVGLIIGRAAVMPPSVVDLKSL